MFAPTPRTTAPSRTGGELQRPITLFAKTFTQASTRVRIARDLKECGAQSCAREVTAHPAVEGAERAAMSSHIFDDRGARLEIRTGTDVRYVDDSAIVTSNGVVLSAICVPSGYRYAGLGLSV
jgi:hypothetical protein